MSHIVRVINGKEPNAGVGGVSDADLSRIAVDFFTSGVVATDDYKVEQQATPDMTVKVAIGNAYVSKPDGTINYSTNLDAVANVTIAANASGNPRIDAIVIKVDTAVTPNEFGNNVATLVAVQGTPAVSPVAPTDSEIQTSVGAGNGFYRLANVTVANGAASITSANISDTRSVSLIKEGALPSTSVAGNQRVRVKRTTDQAIANNTLTAIAWDNEDYDTDTMHDNATNNTRLTFTTAGVYHITGSFSWAANTSNLRFVYVRLNGATNIFLQHEVVDAGNGNASHIIGLDYNFTANDYIEMMVQQTSGGSLNFVGTEPNSFSAFRIA